MNSLSYAGNMFGDNKRRCNEKLQHLLSDFIECISKYLTYTINICLINGESNVKPPFLFVDDWKVFRYASNF